MGPAGGSSGGGGGGPVVVDGVTITGTGVEGDPLIADVGAATVVGDGTTVSGDGSVGDPLAVVPAGLAEQVAVAVDGVTITGTGTTADPLVASAGAGTVFTDGVTITGDGSVGDPLVATGAGDSLVLVNDAVAVVEDTPAAVDLFANDLPVGEWTLLEFRIPSADVGGEATQHFPSTAGATVPGFGTLVLAADGTGTFTPALNVFGVVPVITIIAQGPSSSLRYSTLAFTISAVNDPPVARNVTGVSINNAGDLSDATVSLYGAVSDPDGDAVTITEINDVPIVFDAPIALTGGTMTVALATGIASITPDPGRVDPIIATYTCSDGVLTAQGTITVIIASPQNLPMISPVAPYNPADEQSQHRVDFATSFMQEDGPDWPLIGPPDGEGNLSLVTVPPYSSGQGYYSLVNKEPWLYDRVRACYLLWEATQNEDYKAVAVAWAELYMANVAIAGGRGTFTILGNTGGDPQDAKYLYGEIGILYERMTGSTVYYPYTTALYNQAIYSFPAAYNANSAELWTERHHAFTFRNAMAAFYVSGGDTDILAVATTYADLIFSMSAATGAPLHQKNKHEGDADTTNITSPWMSALLVESMLQYYRHTRDVAVLDWIYTYCMFVHDHGLYVADHNEEPEFAGLEGLRIPAYLFGTVTQYAEGTGADMRHARDTAAMFDKGVWAGTERGYDTAELELARDEMFAAALVDDAYWTRGTPLYAHWRNNPPRCYAWLWGTYYALLYDTGAAPGIAPVLLVEGSIAGSTQQGQTLTYTPGTYGGTPAPDETWVWQLAGEDIPGTTDALTFDSVDIGATTVHVTVTNEAGGFEYDTNTITVVPAGAPEISVQPVAQAGEVGAQLVFTCEFTGDPTPSSVVQLDTGSGFATTVTGDLQHNTVGITTTATWTTDALILGDDGVQVRFLVDNGVGSPVPSDAVGISVISQQVAAVTTGAAQYIRVTAAAGGAGFLNFTWCGWLYIGSVANNASLMEVEGVAARRLLLALQDTVQQMSIGDSNTGIGTGWATPPPSGTWLWVTLRGPAAHPGVFTATYRAQGDATTYTMTRANGIEDSVSPVSFLIGGGDGGGCTVRAQHWRAFDSRFSDQACIDEQFNYDPTAGAPSFFAVAQDDGGGGLQMVDASGNGVSIVINGATLSAGGPLTGSIS